MGEDMRQQQLARWAPFNNIKTANPGIGADAIASIGSAVLEHEKAHHAGASCNSTGGLTSIGCPHGQMPECAYDAEIKEWEKLYNSSLCDDPICQQETKTEMCHACTHSGNPGQSSICNACP